MQLKFWRMRNMMNFTTFIFGIAFYIIFMALEIFYVTEIYKQTTTLYV